jgi:protein-tyrosine phosphatase
LAEGILQAKLPKTHFHVDSAGTGSWHIGSPPDKRSIAVAKQNGVDISHQRGRQIEVQDFFEHDYIYVMDASNYRDVLDLAPDKNAASKVKMILDEIFPGENVDVPDPYYGLENGFVSVYHMLNEACDSIAKNLLEKHS